MIECWRGTSDTEASHHELKETDRSWKINIRTSHCQSSEFTHRYNNIRVLQRRVAGFPKIGHDDTWLVDLLQKLVLHNHRFLFCPNWLNSSDLEVLLNERG
jgi:hypothetical protein